MLRRALDQGCQKLSDGTRIDISDVRFVDALSHFFLCTGNPLSLA